MKVSSIIAVLTVFFFTIFTPSAHAKKPKKSSAEWVLEKHIKAIGGRNALNNITSIYEIIETSNVDPAKNRKSIRYFAKNGVYYHRSNILSPAIDDEKRPENITVRNDSASWAYFSARQVRGDKDVLVHTPPKIADSTYLVPTNRLIFPANYERLDLHWKREKNRPYNGKSYYVISYRLSPSIITDARTYLYFHPKTFMLEYEETNGRGTLSTNTVYSNFETNEGVIFPRKMSIFSDLVVRQDGTQTEAIITDRQLNLQAKPEWFIPPAHVEYTK